MEIELNFRLDEHGRTSIPRGAEEEGSVESPSRISDTLDYKSKTILTSLAPSLSPFPDDNGKQSTVHQQWLDDLLFDCQISDSGLMPRTFWMPAEGMEPRCQLEQMALDIFYHHVPSSLKYDLSCSGAEWWAQIRPSPEGTGRYAMHDDQPDELSRTGISFHWDKDEDLRLLTGGTTYIHPHLSTVTYLTDLGAPTLALNHRVHSLTGEWISPSTVEGFVSWPRIGKHLSFDGRYLHAAPMDLMEPGSWEKQLIFPTFPTTVDNAEESQPRQMKLLTRRHRRVTFLVNIWLNYKPFDIQSFPDTMIDKMSGKEKETRKPLDFVKDDYATADKLLFFTDEMKPLHQTFTWPMGDSDSKEFVQAQMPIQAIREAMSAGGNTRIQWQPCEDKGNFGIRLYRESCRTESGVIDKREAESELDATETKKRPKDMDPES